MLRLLPCHTYIFILSTKQPFAEGDHLFKTLQPGYDRMIRNILEKYHDFPGFALLLGSLLWFLRAELRAKRPLYFMPGLMASFYLIRRRGEGCVLDNTGFSAIGSVHSVDDIGILEFLTYFEELLENSERSKTHVFDQQRYMIASKECLQLCLCSHHDFSNRATEFTHRDNALRRNTPWFWRGQLGVHSRIRKCRHHLKARQWNSFKGRYVDQYASLPDNCLQHDYYRSLSYRWALDLLPFFLERSAISLDLA